MFHLLLWFGLVVKSDTQYQPRIIGGYPVKPKQFPWQVSIQNFRLMLPDVDYQWKHVCGGAIIAPTWIITADHCITPYKTRIRVGTINWKEGGTLHTIVRVIRGPHKLDVVLMKIRPPLDLLNYPSQLAAVCLPDQDEEFEGTATITGWGSTFDSGGLDFKYPDEMRAVDLPILADEVCDRFYDDVEWKYHLCAGDMNDSNQKGSCYADSGGPLVTFARRLKLIIGVLSKHNKSAACGMPDNPAVYVKVASLREWILKSTGNEAELSCKK